MTAIEKRLTETDQSKAKAMERERKKLNKRLAELDRLFSSLYEDKIMERITERNFEMMSVDYISHPQSGGQRCSLNIELSAQKDRLMLDNAQG